ncbi:MAG TPA: ribose 5-phosphate isomerase B [Chitinivibrionales bacterium]|nr:ribose 5-phosphate isomerase B [Chitinivibrionales bacterium]
MPQPDNAIVIGADHAGYKLKEHIKQELQKMGIPCEDVGVFSEERSDYPIYSARAAAKVSNGTFKRGIVICGSGIGASIVANRFKGVRAALCVTPQMAAMSRLHNDANMLVLGQRTTPDETATEILKNWLSTPFEGGRHEHRVKMIDTVDGTQ